MQTNLINTYNLSSDKVDQLQRLINDIARYYSTCDHFCAEQLGITAAQGYTLLAIPEASAITMNELSAKMRLATSTMTRMADQLIQKGLIERQTAPEDRRMVRVYLTEKGCDVQAQLKVILQDTYSQVLAGIPNEERDAVLNSLELLNDSISRVIKCCCGQDLISYRG